VRARMQSEDLSQGAGWLRRATLDLRALSLETATQLRLTRGVGNKYRCTISSSSTSICELGS
jgi:hypothetical protein